MIYTHADARDYAKQVLAHCDTSRIARPELSGYKERDDRNGALYFTTNKNREDCDVPGDGFSPGNQHTLVVYTLPVEPKKLRRDIIIHYDLTAFREM